MTEVVDLKMKEKFDSEEHRTLYRRLCQQVETCILWSLVPGCGVYFLAVFVWRGLFGGSRTSAAFVPSDLFCMLLCPPCGGKRFQSIFCRTLQCGWSASGSWNRGQWNNGPMNLDLVTLATTEEDFWTRCGCLLLTMISCGSIVIHAGQRRGSPAPWSLWTRRKAGGRRQTLMKGAILLGQHQPLVSGSSQRL